MMGFISKEGGGERRALSAKGRGGGFNSQEEWLYQPTRLNRHNQERRGGTLLMRPVRQSLLRDMVVVPHLRGGFISQEKRGASSARGGLGSHGVAGTLKRQQIACPPLLRT